MVSDKEFLENLERAFEEAFKENNELDKLLVVQGYNAESSVKRGIALVNKLIGVKHAKLHRQSNA